VPSEHEDLRPPEVESGPFHVTIPNEFPHRHSVAREAFWRPPINVTEREELFVEARAGRTPSLLTEGSGPKRG